MKRTWTGWSVAAALVVALGTMLVGGCGGGGKSRPPLPGVSEPPPISGQPVSSRGIATARFHVDVTTRQVSITPLMGEPRSVGGRAVFTGTAVNFQSSTLLDLPGNLGIKVLRVALINRWNLPIGQLPNGEVTGVRVLFSGFTNVSAFTTDLRAQTVVSTFAGTGTTGSVDGPTTSATFSGPIGVTVDSAGNVYVADRLNHRVRKISNGFVSTLAGSGAVGTTDGAGTAATFNLPWGIAINPIDGAIVVTDQGGNKVRRITPDGRVTTIAGTGATGGTDGAGDVATFNSPAGVAIANDGAIYVAEVGGHRIRKIVFTGTDPRNPAHYTVSTLAGSGTPGFADGIGTAARFNAPRAVAVDESGNVYVADTENHRIRRISPTGEVVTIAGTGVAGYVDGTGDTARFNGPSGIVWVNNTLIVSERINQRIRQIRLREGNASPAKASSWFVATLAGTGSAGSADGSGNVATFNQPNGLAVDGSGNVYVADYGNHKIRKVTPTSGFFPIGVATGSAPTEPVQLANADGVIPNSDFGANLPYIVYEEALSPGAVSSAKEWWFAVPEGVTAFEFTVRVEANTTGLAAPEAATGVGSANVLVRTFAGATNAVGFADGIATQARFNTIGGVAVDAFGNVYVADSANHAIRRISASGIVSTVAGNVGAPASGDVDGFGTQARFNSPRGIAVTADGTVLFVADYGNHKVKRISTYPWSDPTNPDNWTVSTIAGTGTAGAADGPGNTATLNNPWGIALDSWGNVYVTEFSGNRVRRLQFKGGDPSLATNWQVSLVAGDNSAAAGAAGNTDGTGSAARFNEPRHIAVDRAGNLYVADGANHRIRKIVNALASGGGTVSTFAGSTAGYADGTGTSAQFNSPSGVTVDSAGYLYVADTSNHRIRRVSPSGVVTTVAGTGTSGGADGGGNVATFANPLAVAVDAAGNLYVADGTNSERLRLLQRVIGLGAP